MTYLAFHIYFTIPLLLFMVFINRNNSMLKNSQTWKGICLLLFLAISYTTPWDSYLIANEIWSYEDNRVLGSLWHIPYEEYFFFIIQTVVGCLFCAFLLNATKRKVRDSMIIDRSNSILFGIVMIFWLVILLNPPESSNFKYLWLIIAWAYPIIGLQFCTGYQILMQHKITWLGAVSLLSAYLWIADSIAISEKIWTFPENTISGITIGPILPLEEALFFLCTNLMVTQGFILFTQVDFSAFKFKPFTSRLTVNA